MFQIGDYVRLLQVPQQVESTSDASDEMGTKDVFQQCVGEVFRVRGVGTNSPHGETDHIELWVHDGKDCDSEAFHTIWVEPEYVEAVETHVDAPST